MEASALSHSGVAPALRGPTPLLRLQSDERLIALTRRGQHAAFEVLCARYQSRLLAFCRHMLGSREDAEDVLQEVFAAAFNAVLADEREINVRPWLYRIARNRSLNHLRRASAVGVDSMDVHFADHGMSTGDRAIRRESFRELLSDVHDLPETQRTALLLREIDALSYEQIAHAMETTVPSVKSLLVRARISLAEAAEARKLSCEEVRLELGEVAEGLVKLSPPARRHVRGCERCRFFKKQLKENNHALAAIMPVGPLLLFKKLLAAKLGSAGSAQLAGGASAGVGAGAAAGAGGASAGGIFTVGAGAIASKAVAGLAAAAIVGAGVAADQSAHHRHAARTASASLAAPRETVQPAVIEEHPQPITIVHHRHSILARAARTRRRTPANATPPPVEGDTPAAPPAPPAIEPAPAAAPEPAVTQVTSESTQLPSTSTADPPQVTTAPPATTATPVPASSAPTTATTPPVVTTQSTPTEPTPPPTPPTGESGPTTTPVPPPADSNEAATASTVQPQASATPPQETSAGTGGTPAGTAAPHRFSALTHRWGARGHLR